MTSVELSERLMDFAARTGKMVDALPDTRLGRQIASQLVRSCTSPVANYEEACGSESRRDFVHKLSICLKELRETHAWIRLTIKAGLLPETKLAELREEGRELCCIIAQSRLTAKKDSTKEKINSK